ncbi:hypothetical protein BDB00DRAFT_756090 [Zychaea mexicana]|uniref:uncharacterized protein n=1 Tax=Zychaea mexicana TaxID=64656 RepID=UPI0022FE3A5D|nr:uncharacterized protein BDB00DRAFT_756090 [Zychaea mexicana]KAI9497794.1 hypothetical protein BDB00DRAFT_756090 [Zychaea mexicana]
MGEFGRRVSDRIALSPSVQAIFTAKHLGTLMDIWTKAHPDHIPSQKTYDALLAIYAAEGDMTRLNSALADMQQHNIQPTQYMLNALLRTSVTSPSYAKALYKASNRSNKLDKEGYASFIQAFVNAGDLESAQRVAKHMKKRPFTVSTSSHMAIVQGWVRQGQVEKAAAWLAKCNYAKLVKNQCQATLDPYAIVLEGYLHTGKWGRCMQLLDSIKYEAPMAQQNRRIVKATLAARIARGDFGACERILREKQIDFTPMTIQRITHTTLDMKENNTYSVPGRSVVKGLELMETLLDLRVSAAGLSRLIDKLGERGDIQAAYDLYQRARNDGRPLSLGVFRSMMEAAIKNNDTAMAEKVTYHINQTGSEHRHQTRPSLSSYNMLLNAYASRQPEPHLARMTRTFRKMLEDGHKPDVVTYNTLIKAFVQMENQKAARSIFQEMNAAGHRADSWTLNTIIQGWIAQMDWHNLEQFIKEIKIDGYVLDTVTFNVMLEGLLRLNNYEIRMTKLWKRQNRWSKLKQHEKHPKNAPSSKTVWEIFESAVGVKRADLEEINGSVEQQLQQLEENRTRRRMDVDQQVAFRRLSQLQQEQNHRQQRVPLQVSTNDAFYTLFQHAKPDEVTFKLFMKAFHNANDAESASKIHRYWTNQN